MADPAAPVRLYCLLTEYPNSKALWSGVVSSPLAFDFHEGKIAFERRQSPGAQAQGRRGGKGRRHCQQARSYGKKLVFLPFSMRLGIQDVNEAYDCERGPLNVRHLAFSLLIGRLLDWTAPLRAAQRT